MCFFNREFDDVGHFDIYLSHCINFIVRCLPLFRNIRRIKVCVPSLADDAIAQPRGLDSFTFKRNDSLAVVRGKGDQHDVRWRVRRQQLIDNGIEELNEVPLQDVKRWFDTFSTLEIIYKQNCFMRD